MTIKTVGDLKKLLEGIDDSTLVVSFREGMEKRGYLQECYADVGKFNKKEINTFDVFDGTPYSYESFFPNKYGEFECLYIC